MAAHLWQLVPPKLEQPWIWRHSNSIMILKPAPMSPPAVATLYSFFVVGCWQGLLGPRILDMVNLSCVYKIPLSTKHTVQLVLRFLHRWQLVPPKLDQLWMWRHPKIPHIPVPGCSNSYIVDCWQGLLCSRIWISCWFGGHFSTLRNSYTY